MSLPRDFYLLVPTLTLPVLDAALRRATDGRVRSVVVPPVYARHCVDALRGSGVRVVSVVGYPLGLNKATLKAIEATGLAKDGVDAIEVVPLCAPLIEPGEVSGRFDRLRAELLEIARGCRAARPGVHIDVRLDLDRVRLEPADWAELGRTIVRSACDGVVLAGLTASTLIAARALLDARLPLARSVQLPDGVRLPDLADADAFAEARLDAIGAGEV